MSVYYFETLPIHPQPAHLESLTSYLTRLAQANGLATPSQLFKLSFPTASPKFSFRTGDFPPASFGSLSTLTQCPEPRLLATTFYHLGKKFDRTLQPQPLAQFLSDSIAPRFLRYCPRCLAERGYYSLLWRFLALEGCPEHACRLLDLCGHCRQPVPLLSRLPKLGWCPSCGRDLSSCPTEPVRGNLQQSLSARYADLSYLLSCQPCERQPRRLAPLIGQRLRRCRRARYLKGGDLTRSVGLSLPILTSIEGGNEQRPASFHWYLRYADFLQISWPDIFSAELDYPPRQPAEARLLQQMEQAIAWLEQQGQPVTQQNIVQLVDGSLAIFYRYPQVRARWDDYKLQRKRQQQADVLKEVDQAIAQLRQQGQKVSRAAVCTRLGLSYQTLKLYHPAAWAIVEAQSDYPALSSPAKQPRALYQRQDELLAKVEQAIATLRQQGQAVSQRSVAKVVGLSSCAMCYYPRVRALIKASKPQSAEQVEDELYDKVQTALTTLLQADEQVTVTAVSRMVGLAPGTLKNYPRVSLLLDQQIKQKYQLHARRRRQRREAELVEKVTQAIERLQTNDLAVTQIAICEMVKMSAVNLKRYPKVKLLLQQATGLSDSARLLALQQAEAL